jgi:hypothetical protein
MPHSLPRVPGALRPPPTGAPHRIVRHRIGTPSDEPSGARPMMRRLSAWPAGRLSGAAAADFPLRHRQIRQLPAGRPAWHHTGRWADDEGET